MSKAKKKVFSIVKAVKENARDRVGPVPPERVIPDPKQKAAAKPKHKKTLADLLSTEGGIGMNRLRTVGLIFVGLGLARGNCTAQMPGQGIAVSKDNRTIAITATDSVTAMADVATVHVGFVVYGVDHDSAYAAGSKASNAIVSALKGAGVPTDAIESENQNLAEVQPYQLEKLSDAEKARRKWALSQSWTVRTNAADAARVLDLAVKAGANQSGAIEWSLKDENKPQAEAAGKALQRARVVAEEMARGLNVKLGALIFASNETQAAPVRPMPMMMKAAAAPAPPLAINAQIEKTATVYAVFAIE